ncbi:MAG: hypothetical protein FWF10_04575 [Clostridiales bacterium]|nr:hypothetical protein [Clostridiales bacterium]
MSKFVMRKCNTCQGEICFYTENVTNIVYLCCDDCEVEFTTPQDAATFCNGTRNKFGLSRFSTIDEIKKTQWDKYIIN